MELSSKKIAQGATVKTAKTNAVALENSNGTAVLGSIGVADRIRQGSAKRDDNALEIIASHPFKAWATATGKDKAFISANNPNDSILYSVTGNPYVRMELANGKLSATFCSKKVKQQILAEAELGNAVTYSDVVSNFDLAMVKAPKTQLNAETNDYEIVLDKGKVVYEEFFMIVNKQVERGVDNMDYE